MNFAAAKEIFNSFNDSDKDAFVKSGGTLTGGYADYMQLLEMGLSPAMLGKQFDAVRNISGGDTNTMIERFKNMYGLNYLGASKVWEMEKSYRANPEAYTAEQMAKEIEAMKTSPKYESDSAKLQNAMNKVADNLANIGKIKFDDTEWKIIEEQKDHVAAIRAAVVGEHNRPSVERRENTYNPEVGEGGAILSDTIITRVADEYGRSDLAIKMNLERLSAAAGQKRDLNNQSIGNRYNTEVFPLLEGLNGSDLSKEVVDLVFQLQKEYSEAVYGTGARSKVDDNELAVLNKTMNSLIEELRVNTRSTDSNTKADKDIYFTSP